jgi:hypothetical protein
VALNQNFSILDFALIIPGAMGSALTGYIMCKKTSWGFTRFWWIITKGILTIALFLIGRACLGPWQLKILELSKAMGNTLIANASYDVIRVRRLTAIARQSTAWRFLPQCRPRRSIPASANISPGSSRH